MTDLLEEALTQLRERPAAEQDEAAKALLAFLDRAEPRSLLTPEQSDEVERTLEGLRDGTVRIATEEETQAMWRRWGL